MNEWIFVSLVAWLTVLVYVVRLDARHRRIEMLLQSIIDDRLHRDSQLGCIQEDVDDDVMSASDSMVDFSATMEARLGTENERDSTHAA